jgi:hypothetical protein
MTGEVFISRRASDHEDYIASIFTALIRRYQVLIETLNR